MMADITGVVQDISVRDVAGGRKSYDVIIAGEKYGAGLYAPKCKVGDYVKFELDDSRGYKNIARNSLKVSANKPPAEAVAAAAATPVSTTGAYMDNKQDVISRQAASNTAIAFLTIAQNAGALGLPASEAKGKKLQALDALLQKYTEFFYESNTGTKFKSISPSKATDDDADDEGDAAAEDAPADTEWN